MPVWWYRAFLYRLNQEYSSLTMYLQLAGRCINLPLQSQFVSRWLQLPEFLQSSIEVKVICERCFVRRQEDSSKFMRLRIIIRWSICPRSVRTVKENFRLWKMACKWIRHKVEKLWRSGISMQQNGFLEPFFILFQPLSFLLHYVLKWYKVSERW